MPEELPDDATIEQIAEAFGVADHVNELTPNARSLTKGQMVAILGADNAQAAAWQVVTSTLPPTSRIGDNAGVAGVDLSVADIRSIEEVFGGDAFPAQEKVAMLTDLSNRLQTTRTGTAAPMLDSITIYVCCCPCCCATAVLEPTAQTVA